MITEQELNTVHDGFAIQGKPSEKAKICVDKLRHLRMDPIEFDHSDNALYLSVYKSIMESISCDFPFLSGEVQRQVRKKERWQARRSDVTTQGVNDG